MFQPPDLLKAVEFLGKELKRWVKFEEENRSFIECFRIEIVIATGFISCVNIVRLQINSRLTYAIQIPM